MRALAITLVVASGLAHASGPGQPLDCSDWESVLPGVTCEEAVPMPCTDSENQPLAVCTPGNPTVTDNDGYSYYLTYEDQFPVTCAGEPSQLLRHAVVHRVRGPADQVVGVFRARCGNPPGSVDSIHWSLDCSAASQRMTFDATRGRLEIPVCSLCEQQNGNNPPCVYGEIGGGWIRGSVHRIALGGFTTTFEILQTYTPSAAFGFRVPYMPEGLPAADHFDTYYGPLVKPINFSQAHGLRCDYPSKTPSVGDYLEVADTVPTPAPGQGVYYVTAVTHQGQTRYGRKARGGVLSGRDPAGLAACSSEK